jgi:hypothetical protein
MMNVETASKMAQLDGTALEREPDWKRVLRMAEIVRTVVDTRLRRRSNCAAIGTESNPELRPAKSALPGCWQY